MLENLIKHLNSFVSECGNCLVPYEKKGICNIEAFYWWALVGHYKPDMIIESGICRGRSTHVLAKAQLFFDIKEHYAFDKDGEHEAYVRNKLTPYKTNYFIQDSQTGISKLLDKNKDKKCLFFIDGPKHGKPYLGLLKTVFKFNGCLAVASHDCYPKSLTRIDFVNYCSVLKQFKLFMPDDKVNTEISFVNDCLKDDIRRNKITDDEFNKTLFHSNFVGICGRE